MSYDYYINYTDPLKPAFVVKPRTVNGYATPDSVPLPAFFSVGGITAVSANTSLVFVGKGLQDYGDAVQNNFLYLLENFANVNPPIAHIEGQLWYKNADLVDAPNPEKRGMYVSNGGSWDRLLVETSTGLTSNFNMGGFNITNVGGTGATFNAASENYVTASITTHAGNVALHLTTAQNALLDGLSATLTSVELNYVEGVTSAIQSQLNGKLSTTGGTLTGVLSLGSNRITSLATPIAVDDAATKAYVDAAVVAAGSADGVVNSGSLDPITGLLTLNRTIGTPVVITGTFAPSVHTHVDSVITHEVSSPTNQSFIHGQSVAQGTYPTPSVYNTLVYLDQAVYQLQRQVERQLIVSTGVTTVNLASKMAYGVGENKLQIFVNGIKQYASERGSSIISYASAVIGLESATGLTPSTAYSFDITVNGGAPTTVTITTPAATPYTFVELLFDISTALATLAVNAVVNIDQHSDRLDFVFTSLLSGNGSAVTVSFGVGSLFNSIVATTVTPPVNTAITVDYAYNEVGVPGETSTQVSFAVAPAVGAVLEVLLWP